MASFLDFLEDAKRKLKQSLNTGVQQTHQFFGPASNRLNAAAQRLQAPDTRFTKVSNFMNTVGREWAVPTAKTGDYFGIGRKGLGQFGVDIKRSVQPAVLNTRKIASDVRRSVQPAVLNTRKVTSDVKRYFPVADRAVRNFRTRANTAVDRVGDNLVNRYNANGIVKKYNAQPQWAKTLHNYSPIPIQGRIARDYLFRPTTRALVAGAGTIGNYMGKKEVQFTPKTSLEKMLLGTEPVYSVKGSVIKNAPTAEKYLRKVGINDPASARTLAATAAMAGIVSDLTPFGGGKKAAVKGGSKVAKSGSKLLEIAKKYDKLDDFINSQKDKAGKITKEGKELAKRMWEETHGVQPKVLTGKASTQKYDKLVEPKTGLDALRGEARKYKSAEEFVKAQGTPVYHGGTKIDEVGNMRSKWGAFYMSDNPTYAKSYGGKNSVLNEMVINPEAKLADLRKPNSDLVSKIEEIISPKKTGKTLKIQKPDGSFVEIPETKGGLSNPVHSSVDIIQGIKDGKAYYAEMPEVKEALKKLGYDGMITQESKFGANYGVWNKDVIKTKSQLTDIWNKAQSLSTNKGTQTLTTNNGLKIDENMAKFGFKKGEYTYPKSLNQESSTVGTSQVKEVLPIKTTPLKTDTPPTTPKTETVEQAISRKVRQKSFAKAGGDNSLSSIVEKTATNVKQKVNILYYFRTPDRVMKKIGLGAETETLRKSYDKYLDELPKEIDKVKTWAQQTSKQENKNIFRYLDGQKIQLTDKERTIANEVRGYLKDWADKLGLPKEKRITNYITHIFDKDFIQKEFPEDVAKIIKDRVAGSVYDPFVEKRLGKLGYVEDTWAALDAYVKRATRKYNLDPVLGDISKKAEKLELSQLDYVKKYIDRVNMRPTEIDNLFDNFIKSTPIGYKLGQRPTALLTRAGRQMVYRGTLGLNVSSSLKNLSQGANTYAKLGEKYTAKGYFDLAKNYRSSELQDVGVLRDNFIQDKSIGVYKSAIEKADKGLFSLFETAEKINRGAAYYGAKAKALAEGKTEAEAIEFGKKIVRDTQFTFGSIDTPVKMQSDIVKLFTQFQSFTVKQGEFLGEMISKKEWAGLARWIGSSLLFVYGVGKLFGMEPKDLIPSLRFDTPATLKAPVELGKYLVGAPNRYGQPTSLKDVGQSFIQYVPGGVQGKKTIEGLQAVDAGETKSGNKLVPIAQSTKNYVRGALFGKYNLPEVQAYRELKDKVTKEVNAFKKSSDSIKPLSDGNYAVRVGDEVKKYDTEKKAQRAVNKEDFKKTGKNIQVIGDEVYRLGKEGNVTVTPKTSYDYSLNTNKMQSAKAKDDYKTWVNIANKQLGILEQQLQDPTLDELEQSDIIEKAEILMRSMQKYAGYGGFTKPKSGGGRSGRSPSVTRAITMAKATPGVSKIKATTGSYNSAKSRGKIKVAVAPPSVKIPISKKYTGKQLAQMR